MPGLGPIQRRVMRAFLANPGARLTTGDLIRWSYPRLKGNPPNTRRHFSVRLAAEAVAVKVGRTYPGGFIWVGKSSHDKSQSLPSDDEKKR